jgi:hypothetical protein
MLSADPAGPGNCYALNFFFLMALGFELKGFTLASRCSTPEPLCQPFFYCIFSS